LTVEQRDRFLTDGYLELRPSSISAADNEVLYRRAGDLYDLAASTGSPTAHLDVLGDSLRARVPEIDRVLTDPVIDGVLTGLLGPDYLIHPHCYCHRSSEADQVFHQDGNLPWNERGHVRSHRCDWLMLFYYPQDVDDANGPTEVVPGSQYWTVDHETPDGGWHSGDRVSRDVDPDVFVGPDLDARDRAQREALIDGLGIEGLARRFLHVPAGTVVVAHYDLFHRGSRTTPDAAERYLYKFYFARVHDPVSIAPQPSPGDHCPVAELERRLLTGREDERVDAAYSLGADAAAGSLPALDALTAALTADAEGARRAAGHGLREAGPLGVSRLLAAVDASGAPTRRVAVAGLGTEAAAATRPAEIVACLSRAVADDPDDLVRSNAAYSLGRIARSLSSSEARGVGTSPVAEIVDALLGRLVPGAEPDNAHNAGFSRSTVRQSAAFGLAVVLANHRLGDAHVAAILDLLAGEADRYVRGLIIEGLGKAEARGYVAAKWGSTVSPA
jgi:hypothetical protein